MKTTSMLTMLMSLASLAPNVDALAFQKGGASTRRDLFQGVVSTSGCVMGLWLAQSQAALATAAGPPTDSELKRLQVGLKQINYLLDNWEQETTTCRENGGECKRDADKVRKALGLRSTTDPLFQIDKVFEKVKNLDLDIDKLEVFFEATENWNSAITMSNSMAFISQFGEYNPGGDKDEVLKYLNESQKQVILAKKALEDIMDSLDIPRS